MLNIVFYELNSNFGELIFSGLIFFELNIFVRYYALS